MGFPWAANLCLAASSDLPIAGAGLINAVIGLAGLINGVTGLNSPAASEGEDGAVGESGGGASEGEDGAVGEDEAVGESGGGASEGSCCSARRWQRFPMTIGGGDFNVCGGA